MEYKRASEVLYKGQMKEGMIGTPETLPCFLTTAFVMKDLDELGDVTQKKGYTYIRKSNPNRTALADKISYLEGSEDSLIFSSGMGAITTSLLTVLKPGDHVVCNSNIYGETYEVLTEILPKMNVSVSFVDLRDLAKAAAALTPRTKLLYTEVLSNPTLTLADIEELSRMAHDAGALCMVDNTFTSPVSIRPLEWGVDLVVNSLTKFLNGHSDVMAGSVSARSDLVAQIQHMSMLCGTAGDPFSSWLVCRSLETASLRIRQQMNSAARLAGALALAPQVKDVNHPSLPDYPQKELAGHLFRGGPGCAMLSFTLPEDRERINAFMDALHFARYAPTLGGVRTTLSHPVTSSHPHVPDAVRRSMGITPGMIRVSVGLEDPDDLIGDFLQALHVFN